MSDEEREADLAEVRRARQMLYDSACVLVPLHMTADEWLSRQWTLRLAREHGIEDELVHIVSVAGCA